MVANKIPSPSVDDKRHWVVTGCQEYHEGGLTACSRMHVGIMSIHITTTAQLQTGADHWREGTGVILARMVIALYALSVLMI
jgi:hypothetical protein